MLLKKIAAVKTCSILSANTPSHVCVLVANSITYHASLSHIIAHSSKIFIASCSLVLVIGNFLQKAQVTTQLGAMILSNVSAKDH